MATIVTPGQRLGDTKSVEPSSGTFVLGDSVYASVVGVAKKHATGQESKKQVIEVVQDTLSSRSVLPNPGDVVTCRVTKVNVRFASVEILSGTTLYKEPYSGTIRQRDVRAFDIDSVEIYKSFRPGDIVRAEVLSLGDARSYFLSTAKNELGVVLAQSAAGHIMVPISWQMMQCPVTKAKEHRRVARVDQPQQAQAKP